MGRKVEKGIISVVVPAYNEEGRLGPTLDALWRFMRESFGDFELIVVDDGSTDGTLSLAKGKASSIPNIRVLENERNRGKGCSVRKGFLASRGDLVLLCDADMSTPVEETDRLLGHINEGWDIAIGSRGLRDSDIVVRQPWYRERMGKTFNLIVRLVLMGGIKDTQCGFKLFRGDVARRLFRESRINGFAFDAEVLFIAGKSGYRIKELPVRWINSPHSKVRVFRDSAMMFLEILKVRLNWIRGVYDPSNQ